MAAGPESFSMSEAKGTSAPIPLNLSRADRPNADFMSSIRSEAVRNERFEERSPFEPALPIEQPSTTSLSSEPTLRDETSVVDATPYVRPDLRIVGGTDTEHDATPKRRVKNTPNWGRRAAAAGILGVAQLFTPQASAPTEATGILVTGGARASCLMPRADIDSLLENGGLAYNNYYGTGDITASDPNQIPNVPPEALANSSNVEDCDTPELKALKKRLTDWNSGEIWLLDGFEYVFDSGTSLPFTLRNANRGIDKNETYMAQGYFLGSMISKDVKTKEDVLIYFLGFRNYKNVLDRGGGQHFYIAFKASYNAAEGKMWLDQTKDPVYGNNTETNYESIPIQGDGSLQEIFNNWRDNNENHVIIPIFVTNPPDGPAKNPRVKTAVTETVTDSRKVVLYLWDTSHNKNPKKPYSINWKPSARVNAKEIPYTYFISTPAFSTN